MIDEGKLEIVSSEASDRLVVHAKPGVGKTFTLVMRTMELIDNKGLLPSEIVILTFSRAAVSSIRNQISSAMGGRPGDIPIINTFDSFIGKALYRSENQNIFSSYENNIEFFIELLKGDESLILDELSSIKHIFIDEAQDLVGIRLFLVEKLIGIIPGVTFFCDIAQGIYRFTLTGMANEVYNDYIFEDWIDKQSDILQIELENNRGVNYRLNSKLQKLEDDMRKSVVMITSENPYMEIISLLETKTNYGVDSTAMIENLKKQPSNIIVTRNTLQLWRFVDKIIGEGLQIFIIPTSQERFIDYQFGLLFYDYQKGIINQDLLKQISKSKNIQSYDEMWERLEGSIKILDPTKTFSSRVGISDIRASFHRRSVQEYLYKEPVKGIVKLGTIHRVKGREFDNVTVIIHGETSKDQIENLEEARITYVGTTRAKKNFNYVLFSKESKYHIVRFVEQTSKWITGIRNRSQNIAFFITIGDAKDYDQNYLVSRLKNKEDFFELQERILNLEFYDELNLLYNERHRRYFLCLTKDPVQHLTDNHVLMSMSVKFTEEMNTIHRYLKNARFKRASYVYREKIIRVSGIRHIGWFTAVLPVDVVSAACRSGIHISPRIGGDRGQLWFE